MALTSESPIHFGASQIDAGFVLVAFSGHQVSFNTTEGGVWRCPFKGQTMLPPTPNRPMVFSTPGQIHIGANTKTENNTKLTPKRLGTAIINR